MASEKALKAKSLEWKPISGQELFVSSVTEIRAGHSNGTWGTRSYATRYIWCPQYFFQAGGHVWAGQAWGHTESGFWETKCIGGGAEMGGSKEERGPETR